MQLSNIFEIPVDLRQRAMRIVNEIHQSASAYTSWKGQRLHHNREIVSVPLMGDKYRLLFRFVGANDLRFCGACTHQVYDKIIQSRNTGSIKPMRPTMDERLDQLSIQQTEPGQDHEERAQPHLTLVQRETAQALTPAETPDQALSERKPRNAEAGKLIRDAVMAIPVGQQFVPFLFCESLSVSDTSVSIWMREMTEEGLVRLIGREGNRSKYERLAHSEAEISTENLVTRIQRDLAMLASRIKPAASLESFSDDDIAMETLRRMARKAA